MQKLTTKYEQEQTGNRDTHTAIRSSTFALTSFCLDGSDVMIFVSFQLFLKVTASMVVIVIVDALVAVDFVDGFQHYLVKLKI